MNHLCKIPVIVILVISLTIGLTSCEKVTPPVVTTASVSAITQTTASSGGNVTDDGGAEVTTKGVCWCTTENPTTGNSITTDGSGTGSFTSNLTSLTPGTEYYVRAYAINSEGTAYGNQVSFMTQAVQLPSLTTDAVSSITQTTAVSGGNITDDGGGEITAKGVCWSTSQSPTTDDNNTDDGSGTGAFISNLTGLNPNAAYYVRAYATNSAGTSYGNQVSFTTTSSGNDIIFNPDLTYGTISDIDGNAYKTIQIGTQIWMAENLKTTSYNDGTGIPLVTDEVEWSFLDTAAYCWFDNDEATYKAIYGALYNWYTVNTGKLCPTGWHVPTDTEWTLLTDYLGGLLVAGGKLKETGTTHWSTPNTSATNETGFTALPGGCRHYHGLFSVTRQYGLWWSATEYDVLNALYPLIRCDYGGVLRYQNFKTNGMSVRCVKD